MDWISIALLLLFGILFLIAEVLFIPGTTVVGLAGFALLAAGIWFGYRDLGTSAGHITLATALVLAAATLAYLGYLMMTALPELLAATAEAEVAA